MNVRSQFYVKSHSSHVISSVYRSDLESSTEGGDQRQWFYEGRNGWWKFERRNSEEIEEAFRRGDGIFETLICGHIYVIDFGAMVQYRKDFGQGRKRKIKSDVVFAQCKGVAGLMLKREERAMNADGQIEMDLVAV